MQITAEMIEEARQDDGAALRLLNDLGMDLKNCMTTVHVLDGHCNKHHVYIDDFDRCKAARACIAKAAEAMMARDARTQQPKEQSK